ncbi:DUF6427 family protein [uncultured Kordia sp.]|uniref:DUF6427 family protein n=1 Tax=uncultured Kordia sp. TaxID=507699 RepID=UPI0026262BFB|nr:DUF6427 family protein [uncultured Kordia sp.]
MITSVFGKSKPINFILCSGIVLIYFVIYLFSGDKEVGVDMLTLQVPILFLLLFSLFMVDFIVKKNDLTQQNDYALLIVTLFIGFFPNIFEHLTIVFIHVFLLLAFRRVISLRSLHSVKQKLFDASMYITIALLFDSWIVLYLLIVYIGIILYVSSDYRNWLVPFVGFFSITIIYLSYIYFTDKNILTNPLFQFDLKIEYPLENYKQIALHSLITLLFCINIVIFFLKIKTYSSQKRNSFLLTNVLFFIGITYILFAKNNTYNTEILLLFPLGISTANVLENIENKRIGNILLVLLMIVSFGFNFYLK